MSRIFISYRREDSKWASSRIHDHICARFGDDQVFMDIAAIEPGDDFVDVIERAIRNCSVVITVIGDRWVNTADAQGKRRLDNPYDFVRLEIATALKQDKRIIPILIDDAKMPQPDELPDDLRSLARRHAITIRNETFRQNASQLINTLEKALNQNAQAVIAGQWRDIYTNTTTFFKQNDKHVVGFYDLDQNQKMGVYIGLVEGNTGKLALEWLDGSFKADAKVELSEDGKRILGYWSPRQDPSNRAPLELLYISDEMPIWLEETDFNDYARFLKKP